MCSLQSRPEERLRGVNPDQAIVALRKALEQRLEDLADEATEKIVTEIPAYRSFDEKLRRDVRAHVMSHLRASLESLGRRREVTREDLLFVRPHAARRARRVSLTDFVQAFYIGERVLWDTALSLATDEDSQRAALAFASHLPRYFEVATTHAAEVYLETQEQLAATGEAVRRDLLEDLLAGRAPNRDRVLTPLAPRASTDGSSFAVISAAAASGHQGRGVAAWRGRGPRPGHRRSAAPARGRPSRRDHRRRRRDRWAQGGAGPAAARRPAQARRRRTGPRGGDQHRGLEPGPDRRRLP